MGKSKRHISRRIPHTNPCMFMISGNQIVRRARIPFSSGLQRRMKVKRNQARCHSISLDCMAAIVENIINKYVNGFIDADSTKSYLFKLGHAAIYLGTFQSYKSDLLDIFSKYIEKISQIEKKGNIHELLQLANDVVFMLNESPFNLRIGDKRINSSISYSFDPRSWIYVRSGKYIDGQHLEWQTGNKGYNDGLYLTDSEDVTRISIILHLLDELKMDYPFGIDVYSMEDEKCMKYIVASSNNLYIHMAALEPYQITGWEIQDGKRMLLKVGE